MSLPGCCNFLLIFVFVSPCFCLSAWTEPKSLCILTTCSTGNSSPASWLLEAFLPWRMSRGSSDKDVHPGKEKVRKRFLFHLMKQIIHLFHHQLIGNRYGIHSFIQQMFVEKLPCTGTILDGWNVATERIKISLPCKGDVLKGGIDKKQYHDAISK